MKPEDLEKLKSDFGKIPKIKESGPTEPVIYFPIKESDPNDYERRTFEDSVGSRIHTVEDLVKKTGTENKNAKHLIELEKFISHLFIDFHFSKFVERRVKMPGKRILRGSVEVNSTVGKISPNEFKLLFLEKYLEAEAEMFLYKAFTNDSNKSMGTGDWDRGEGENIVYYENGEFNIFDFEEASHFFQYFNLNIEYHKNDKLFLRSLEQKLITLKKFYESGEGFEYFMRLASSLKLPLHELFWKTEDVDLQLQGGFSFEAIFYKHFVERINSLLEETQKYLA
jgi:hypothetical protein